MNTSVWHIRHFEEDAPLRLDGWLRRRYPQAPFSSIQKALRRGLVRLKGQKVSGETRLVPKDEIQIHHSWHGLFSASASPKMAAPQDLSPFWRQRLEDWTLLKDHQVWALNKPAGIACQGGSGQKIHIDTLVKEYDPRSPGRLTHRLDVGTSGVLLIARTLSCAQLLTKIFEQKHVKKTYWALVHGVPPIRGVVRSALRREGPLMVIDKAQGLESVTAYRCRHSFSVPPWPRTPLKLLPQGAKNPKPLKLSWVELQPKTGRMHQLRAHMASLGHPIWGDLVYGNPLLEEKIIKGLSEKLRKNLTSFMALHCARMEFSLGEKVYDIQAFPPDSFVLLLRQLTKEAALFSFSF